MKIIICQLKNCVPGINLQVYHVCAYTPELWIYASILPKYLQITLLYFIRYSKFCFSLYYSLFRWSETTQLRRSNRVRIGQGFPKLKTAPSLSTRESLLRLSYGSDRVTSEHASRVCITATTPMRPYYLKTCALHCYVSYNFSSLVQIFILFHHFRLYFYSKCSVLYRRFGIMS